MSESETMGISITAGDTSERDAYVKELEEEGVKFVAPKYSNKIFFKNTVEAKKAWKILSEPGVGGYKKKVGF